MSITGLKDFFEDESAYSVYLPPNGRGGQTHYFIAEDNRTGMASPQLMGRLLDRLEQLDVGLVKLPDGYGGSKDSAVFVKDGGKIGGFVKPSEVEHGYMAYVLDNATPLASANGFSTVSAQSMVPESEATALALDAVAGLSGELITRPPTVIGPRETPRPDPIVLNPEVIPSQGPSFGEVSSTSFPWAALGLFASAVITWGAAVVSTVGLLWIKGRG